MFSLLLWTLLLLFLAKIIQTFTFWRRHGIPGRLYPTFGWMYKSVNHFLEDNNLNHKIYGDFIMFNKLLIVNDPQLARDLSVKQLHDFPVRVVFYLGMNSLSKSLFFLDANDDWKRIRSIVTPAFTSGKLKAMMEPINEIGDQLINNLRQHALDNDWFNIKPHFDGFTMEVIARCAYGVQIDSINQPNHPIILNAKQILNTNITLRQITCIMSYRLAKLLNLDFFDSAATEFFDELTKTIINKRKVSNQNFNDLIGLMMKGFENVDDEISLAEISAQSVLFFIAGHDTTNAVFNHTMYFLGKHPEWQEKLYDELKNKRLEYDELNQLPVLNAIIYEVLRLKPSLATFDRVADKDCYLLDTGIRIPKGTNINIQPYIIHRNPDYFEDPESFKPERFIGTGLENNVAYLPFGAGNRFCVGMRFALNELRIGLSKFFLNYKVELADNFKLEYFTGGPLLSPKNVKIRLSQRK